MAFEFDPDAMFKACALYLTKGLILVRVHGIWPDGRCTCGRKEHAIGRSGERNCGKHPVGDDWANNVAATEDDIWSGSKTASHSTWGAFSGRAAA